MDGPTLRLQNPVRFFGSIPAGQSIDLDTLTFGSYRSNKYLIQFYNDSEGKFKQLELATSKKNGDVSDQVYSKSGDTINVEANFLVSGADAILRLINNEAFVVDVTALRFNL